MRIFGHYLINNIPHEGETGAGAGAGAGKDGAGAGAGAGAGKDGAGAGAGAGKDGAGAGAGAGEKWYGATLEKEHADYIEGHKFDGVASLAKTAAHFEKLARDKNVMLKPDPKKIAEWDGFAELGWTPELKDYKLEKPQAAAGEVLHEGLFNEFSKAAHGAKLAPWQAKAVFETLFKFGNSELKALDGKRATDAAALKEGLQKEWGSDTTRRTELARRTAGLLGFGEEDNGELERIVGAPRLVKMFDTIREKFQIQEDQLVLNNTPLLPENIAGIESELNRLEADPEFRKVMNDQRDPRYKEFTTKRRALIERQAKAQARGKAA